MTRDDILKKIQIKFGGRIRKIFDRSPKRIYCDIDKNDIPEVVRFVFMDLGARFSIASGVDTPDGIEILYHFSFDRLGLVFSLRTILDGRNPEIESITPLMKGAEWIEREIHELLGVEFKNHPNMKPLLLPDDWPKDKFPLRRDFVQDIDKE